MANDTEVKPVNKMTAEACLAELKKLSKDVEFDITLKAMQKLEAKELRKLVQEGRDALAEDEQDPELGGEGDESSEGDESESDESTDEESDEESEEEGDEGEDEESTPSAHVPVIPGVRRGEKAISVVCRDGQTRTYAESIQGKNWQVLAKQFAAGKKGSKVIKHN